MSKIRYFLVGVAVMMVGLMGMAVRGKTAVAQANQSRIYLPMIVAGDTDTPPGDTVPFGPIHTGIATYYDATGEGNCTFPATPNDLMVAAINNTEYDNAKWCGAYVRVWGRKGSVDVRIVDRCANCYDAGHLDLSREAFALIDDIPLGRVPITWQTISPPLDGPISYYFVSASHEYWSSVQIRNHRNPIAQFEYLNSNGAFVTVPRQMWNRFDLNGAGPFTFRVTDLFGNRLQDSGIPLTPGAATSGSTQFPPP